MAMKAGDDVLTSSFVSLFDALMFLVGGFVIFGMIYYVVLPTILFAWNAKKRNKREEKRFNKYILYKHY